MRFGHLVPMYRLGAVYVIDGAENEAKIITDYVAKDYIPGMFRPDLRICPGKGILLYVSAMQETGDFYGRIFGREHLVEQQKGKGLTVRESYSAPLGQATSPPERTLGVKPLKTNLMSG